MNWWREKMSELIAFDTSAVRLPYWPSTGLLRGLDYHHGAVVSQVLDATVRHTNDASLFPILPPLTRRVYGALVTLFDEIVEFKFDDKLPSRKLKTKWVPDLIKSLEPYHLGVDAEAEVIAMLSDNVTLEVCRDVAESFVRSAVSQHYCDRENLPFVLSRFEKDSWQVITSPEIAAVLSATIPDYAPAKDEKCVSFGIYQHGTFQGNVVFVDPFFALNVAVFAKRGMQKPATLKIESLVSYKIAESLPDDFHPNPRLISRYEVEVTNREDIATLVVKI
jgi:hypothetical protein